MKKISLILAIVFLVATVFAGAYFNSISGRSDGNKVYIDWETGAEVNVAYYVVEKKTPSTSFYVLSDNITPKGDNSRYEFVDGSMGKLNDDDIYIYRVAIYDKSDLSNPSYSKSITVSHSMTFVKRTWGSIKAMFR